MLADISTGHGWGADLCWLLAALLFAVEVVLALLARRPHRATSYPDGSTSLAVHADWTGILTPLALGLIALGLLLL
jgi:hypothetical protein